MDQLNKHLESFTVDIPVKDCETGLPALQDTNCGELGKFPIPENLRWTKAVYTGDEIFKTLDIPPGYDNHYIVFDFTTTSHVKVDEDRNVISVKDIGKPIELDKEYVIVSPKY